MEVEQVLMVSQLKGCVVEGDDRDLDSGGRLKAKTRLPRWRSGMDGGTGNVYQFQTFSLFGQSLPS